MFVERILIIEEERNTYRNACALCKCALERDGEVGEKQWTSEREWRVLVFRDKATRSRRRTSGRQDKKRYDAKCHFTQMKTKNENRRERNRLERVVDFFLNEHVAVWNGNCPLNIYLNRENRNVGVSPKQAQTWSTVKIHFWQLLY